MKKLFLIIISIMLLPLVGCREIKAADNEYASGQQAVLTSGTATRQPDLERTATSVEVQNTPVLTERLTVTPGIGSAGLTIVEIPILGRESLDTVFEAFGYDPWNDPYTLPSELEIDGDRISYRVEEVSSEEETVSLMEITIFRNDEPIQTIPAGQAAPINVVWGFMAYEDTWYLEINRYEKPEEGLDGDATREMQIHGDIIRDGVSLNEREGYQESFGFNVLAGKVFYFYRRDGGYGYFYDGVEHPLDFAYIAHHQCCSGAQTNPRFFEDEVVVIAGIEDQRYLVMFEIGND